LGAVSAQSGATLQRLTAAGFQTLAMGEPVVATDEVIELRLGGRHRVLLNRGAKLIVEADSIAQSTPAGENLAWRLDLAVGELYAEVVPGSRFAVTTPNALATITGTKFNLRATAEASDLTLVEGSIDFASRGGGNEAVDVRAGYSSQVLDDARPTTPVPAAVARSVAWTNETKTSGHAVSDGQAYRLARIELDQLAGLDALRDEALLPVLPDYRTWSYERFRDEMRPWFAEQFPWAMVLEKALNEEHGIEADYLDVLVISGDVWQFRWPVGEGQRIPVFRLVSADRLVEWYGLEIGSLSIEAGGASQIHGALATDLPTEAVYAEAFERWRRGCDEAVSCLKNRSFCDLTEAEYLLRVYAGFQLWSAEHSENLVRLVEKLRVHGGASFSEILTQGLSEGEDSVDVILQVIDDRYSIVRGMSCQE